MYVPNFVISCRIIDTNFDICYYCRKYFDPSLIVNNTQVLGKFSCRSAEAISFGLAWTTEAPSNQELALALPVTKHLKNNLLDMAILHQSVHMNNTDAFMNEKSMDDRLTSGYQTVKVYEHLDQQNAAREALNYPKIHQYALEFVREGQAEDLSFVKAVTKWFKRDFFTWCNKPKCKNEHCTSTPKDIDSIGMAPPTEEEKRIGWTGRVELYQCKKCSNHIRFPRINNPSVLLQTRSGRCGEWANCFCLICRSLQLDARYVLDFTDHVWVEVWIPSLARYVHIDPCENKVDTPLLYEVGWKKGLNYIFSFSKWNICDAISRYSRKLLSGEIFERRNTVTERYLRDRLVAMNQHITNSGNSGQPLYVDYDGNSKPLLISRLLLGAQEFVGHGISQEVANKRKYLMDRELIGFRVMIGGSELTKEELEGRVSGDINWRKSRGEVEECGTNNDVVATISSLFDIVPWYRSGVCFGQAVCTLPSSTLMPQPSSIDIFACSAGLDDKLDNQRDGYTSTIAHLYSCSNPHDNARSPGGGVFSPSFISISGIPICVALRGHNVAVICSFTGSLVASHSFDSHAGGDKLTSQFLDYLHQYVNLSKIAPNTVPSDYIIVISALDSAENLSPSFYSQLNTSLYGAEKVVIEAPQHRESWLLILSTRNNSQSGPIIHHYSKCQIGKGPLYVKIRLPLLSRYLVPSTDVSMSSPILGYMCNVPSRLIECGTDEPIDTFALRISDTCFSNSTLLGYTILDDQKTALLFSKEGYPLGTYGHERSYTCLKMANSSSEVYDQSKESLYALSSSDIEPIIVRYLPLGGNHYDDTSAFDTTHSLWDMMDAYTVSCQPHTDTGSRVIDDIRWQMCNSLTLESIEVYAGENY